MMDEKGQMDTVDSGALLVLLILMGSLLIIQINEAAKEGFANYITSQTPIEYRILITSIVAVVVILTMWFLIKAPKRKKHD